MHKDQGTYLGKAIKDHHEHDIWMPFDSPYLAEMVEAFTHVGLSHVQSVKNALAGWLLAHNQPQTKNTLSSLVMPDAPVHWSQVEIDAWGAYFHSRPQTLWQPEDWSMLVEWTQAQ